MNFMKNKRLYKIACYLLNSVFCLSAHAELTDEQAEKVMTTLSNLSIEELMEVQITTIATGVKQTVNRAAEVVTVITAKEIEAMGATDLDEVLETVPGLHVARYSWNYSPIYTIRGIYSTVNPEVLILVNGLRINNTQTSNRGLVWGGMPVNAIENIEIICGPGSAVYGTDAFAGVIVISIVN
jgi:iron complex outermembrane receptor protein